MGVSAECHLSHHELPAMASNGNGVTAGFAPVLSAMATMRDGQREQKKAAHAYLESFQKSVCCWIKHPLGIG